MFCMRRQGPIGFFGTKIFLTDLLDGTTKELEHVKTYDKAAMLPESRSLEYIWVGYCLSKCFKIQDTETRFCFNGLNHQFLIFQLQTFNCSKIEYISSCDPSSN